MTLSLQPPQELFKQSEENYLQFLKHYLRMQISYIQNMSSAPSSVTVQEYAEKQLTVSLTLVNNITIHHYSRDIFAGDYLHADSPIYPKEHIEEIEFLIMRFKRYLKEHSFLNDSYKFQCKQLIDQLSRYFHRNHLRVVNIDSVPSKPWFRSP